MPNRPRSSRTRDQDPALRSCRHLATLEAAIVQWRWGVKSLPEEQGPAEPPEPAP